MHFANLLTGWQIRTRLQQFSNLWTCSSFSPYLAEFMFEVWNAWNKNVKVCSSNVNNKHFFTRNIIRKFPRETMAQNCQFHVGFSTTNWTHAVLLRARFIITWKSSKTSVSQGSQRLKSPLIWGSVCGRVYLCNYTLWNFKTSCYL